MKSVDIIIPAYNEEERILPTLEAYANFFFGKKTFFTRLLVVVNGCTDGTARVALSFQKKYPEHVAVLVFSERLGKGGAVHEGFRACAADVCGYVDADNATPPEECMKLLERIDEYDAVIASRWMKGSVVYNRISRLRRLMSWGYRTFVRFLFFMPVHDTQCGAKVFQTKVIREIFPKLSVRDMSFDVEILYTLFRLQKRVLEIPTIWTDNKRVSASFRSPAQIFRTAFGMASSLLSIRFRSFS